ncbi:MAG: outer membrane beta-barrel protein, partial [Mucilaginibacter sp.]
HTNQFSANEFQQTMVDPNRQIIVDTTNYNLNSLSHSSAPSFGGSLLYNHRFNSHGRNFSVLVTGGSSTSNQYQNPVYTYFKGQPNAPLFQQINTDSHTDSAGVVFSYIEPLSKRSYVEANYGYHTSTTTSDKATDTLASDGVTINNYALLSNDYKFTFVTNRFGVNYRFIEKKYNYTLGIAAQPSVLSGESPNSAATNINTFNFSPVARFIYNFSRSQSLSFNYSGASNTPSYYELQPVTDYSNAKYPVVGNPGLNPEYNNTVSLRYNNFSFTTGDIFFTNLNFTQTDNKIVSNTVSYPQNYTLDPKLKGTILTRYQNAPGFYSASAFYLYAKPWDKRKFTLLFNGNLSYNNNISFITNADSLDNETTQKNIAKNLVFTQGVRFRVDITDVIDAEANASYGINHSVNSIPQPNINNNFRTISYGLNGKNYLWKDWTLSYDYTKTIYQGYVGATNPNIFNTYIERRFLKGNVGTLRLSAFDLFNQNTGFTSTQNGTQISQTNANRLGRYYLLTFTLRLQKFAGKGPSRGPGEPGGFRPGGGGGGFRPGGGGGGFPGGGPGE